MTDSTRLMRERAAHKDAWISGWRTRGGASARLSDAEEAYAYEIAKYPESLEVWLAALRSGTKGAQ